MSAIVVHDALYITYKLEHSITDYNCNIHLIGKQHLGTNSLF